MHPYRYYHHDTHTRTHNYVHCPARLPSSSTTAARSSLARATTKIKFLNLHHQIFFKHAYGVIVLSHRHESDRRSSWLKQWKHCVNSLLRDHLGCQLDRKCRTIRALLTRFCYRTIQQKNSKFYLFK